MSGFAGLIRLDGRPVDRAEAGPLQNAVAHRGSDASGLWSDESALLVHAALHTTPESRTETQPYVDGGATIVADIRLDNRAELIQLLGLRGEPIGDAALALAAWRRWGADCARRLEGDFSFAVWDGRTLFCARDPFGVKPFVYCHVPNKLFAFASEARALLAIDDVPRELDEKRIADFLSIQFDDVERTFHRSILRLPGGCTLTMDVGRASARLPREGRAEARPTSTRYWSPDAVRPIRLSSDAEYAEGFREHFRRAVSARMRVTHASELGAFLSGGLDSSAIACMAREQMGGIPLPVFSWIFSDVPEADERRFQELVAESGGMTRHVLDSATAGYTPFTDLELLLPDGPPYAPNHYLNDGAGRLARTLGIKTMLDGLGGDSSISRGGARPLELFVRGRFLTLARELRAIARHSEVQTSAARLFLPLVVAPILPPSLLRLTRAMRGRPSADSAAASYRPHFSVRSEHLAHLQSPMLAEGLELFDRVMAAAGVEGRYPFFDRQLVEYCLALPSDQKLAEGFSRVVARRALAGIVPDEVRWRAGKGKPGLHIIPSLRANRERLDDLLVRDPSALAPYVDVDALRAMYDDFIEGRANDLTTAVRVWSAAALGCWLRKDPP